MRANRRQVGVIGVRDWGCWGTPAVVFLKLLPFIFVTPCLPSHHLPPSLTVPCPSASCRFLIKENISLMPPTSNPPLILSSFLTPSSSVLSFISPPLPCEAAWLTSISLSLESGSWASVCARHAQTKCFSILLKKNSFLSLSPLGFENSCLEHCFPTKQVASYGSHVGLVPGLSV